mmetsp:Transcript_6179/g.10328  ORF Transcript_6179/g.10328 Transcript_6179/m.10328 type:complete len:95 (-) Transcript_6179:82-366(-)
MFQSEGLEPAAVASTADAACAFDDRDEFIFTLTLTLTNSELRRPSVIVRVRVSEGLQLQVDKNCWTLDALWIILIIMNSLFAIITTRRSYVLHK